MPEQRFIRKDQAASPKSAKMDLINQVKKKFIKKIVGDFACSEGRLSSQSGLSQRPNDLPTFQVPYGVRHAICPFRLWKAALSSLSNATWKHREVYKALMPDNSLEDTACGGLFLRRFHGGSNSCAKFCAGPGGVLQFFRSAILSFAAIYL